MTKSYVDMILRLYIALTDDMKSAFPELCADFERDLERLRMCINSRGLGVVLRDLPAIGKHLDQCLAAGQYTQIGLPLTRPAGPRIRTPRFLGGLWLLIFDAQGLLRNEVDNAALVFLRQYLYMAKKVKIACPAEAVDAAIADFLSVDGGIPEPSRFWDTPNDPTVEKPSTSFDQVLQKTEVGRRLKGLDPLLGKRLDRIASLITCSLGKYSPNDWRFKHGPGATAAGSRLVNKYHWVSWPERLEAFFPIAECGFYSHSSWARCVEWSNPTSPHNWLLSERFPFLQTDLEESSRLIAVAKTIDKPRLIAAEPSSHQWCQQNMRHYMYERSLRSWIGEFVRFTDQTQNQLLCQSGSRDGSLATLDLSEASDRVSCSVVEALFRVNPTVLCHLAACRTRFVRVEYGDSVFVHRLNKFSTMGSAVTFPVQSLIFLTAALAALTSDQPTVEEIRDWIGRVSVFGDDIIVPSTARERVQLVLEALGFKVNSAKSFSEGLFRESCGVDAFRGVVVTPTYLGHLDVRGPESMVGMTQTANHFYQRWMLNVSAVLRRTVRQYRYLPDVHPDSGVCGFATRVIPDGTAKYRWNKHLQRVESLVMTCSTRQTKRRATDDSALLQFFTEQPEPANHWSQGYGRVSRLKVKPRWVASVDLYKRWLG